MSENNHDHKLLLHFGDQKVDARVRRTRDALGDALVELMQEKPFDSITVQDVLDRAKVGRSTFYSHYSDKDDALAGRFAEMRVGKTVTLSIEGVEKSWRVVGLAREAFSPSVGYVLLSAVRLQSPKMVNSLRLALDHVEDRADEDSVAAVKTSLDRDGLERSSAAHKLLITGGGVRAVSRARSVSRPRANEQRVLCR